ncbi:MAG: trypsin-like peptidase domain-containing protein [Acidimicrobiia bacterium]|nr:trypsin-like peptidase domain-containing protein [Acidimicrobiia bacterium]
MDNNNPDPHAAFRPPAEPAESVSSAPPQQSPPLFPYAEPVAAPAEPPERKRRSWLGPLLGGFVGAALLALVLWGTGQLGAEEGPPTIREVVTAGEQTSATAVARKVVPSIVTVDVGVLLDGEFQLLGSGSGVVLSRDGLIATNHHVIAEAEEYQVVFSDGRIYTADLVGSDRRTDLAVLRIDADNLVPIELGSTTSAEIGQTAIAVGSPLGLDGGPSVTVGVVSAFGRQVRTGPEPIDTLFDMLQTDAPITEGSSGGALVDANGRLLGITSAIGISSAGAEGIGFAIPVELMSRITDEIIETGAVQHPFIGVSLDTAFAANSDGSQTPAGAFVTGFAIEPSAAADAGIQLEDLITAYNGNPVLIPDDLISGLRGYRAGEEVTLSITRGSEQLEIPVVLGVRPDDI